MPRDNSLILANDRSLYIGQLPMTDRHCHAAPVLLVGLSGRFAVGLAGGRRESCRMAWVDAGVEHVFDPMGETVALLYLEPDAADAARLRPLLAQEAGVVFDFARTPVSRGAVPQQILSLEALVPRSAGASMHLDARVAGTLRQMREELRQPMSRGQAADASGLSASRFNHLFREQVGVSFRSYRTWSQVRTAFAALGPELNLTQAAHGGSFSDSSHFSRTFRSCFGLTPSAVVKPLRTITVI